MTARTAVAAGGNWGTAGTWSPAGIPSAADDLTLNATSGNVTIAGSVAGRSLDCLGYVGTLTHNAASTLTLGAATAGPGNLLLRLVAGMTYTKGNVNTSAMLFTSSAATPQTVTTAGKTLGNVSLQGNTQLADALNATNITHIANTFATANNAVNATTFGSTGATARTLTPGSSTMTLAGAFTISGSNLTVTANTMNVTITAAGADFVSNIAATVGGTLSWTAAAATINLTVPTASTFGALSYACAANQANQLVIPTGISITVAGAFTVTGNSGINKAFVTTGSTAVTISAGSTVLTDAEFFGITATGAAAWTGTRVGDWGLNTGITFTAGTNKFLIGGAVDRNYNGTVWATTSGGAANANNYPMPQDTVVIDGNSWSNTGRTLTLNANQRHARLDATAMPFPMTITGAQWMTTGSVTLDPVDAMTSAVGFMFRHLAASTFTPGALTGGATISVAPPGTAGSLTMAGAYNGGGSLSVLVGSTFNGGAFNHSWVNVGITNPTAADLGSGTWTITGSGVVAWAVSGGGGALALTALNATIAFTSAVALTFNTTSTTQIEYGSVTFVAGAGAVTITNTSNLKFSLLRLTGARSYSFTAGRTYTIADAGLLDAVGSAGNIITITSSSAGVAFTISKATTTVCLDWVSLKDSTGTGGATFSAGANSTNVSGNTGWSFTACPQTTVTISDLEGLTDSIVAASGVTPTDPEGLVDNVLVTLAATISDLEGLTDQTSAATSATIADNEGLTDQASAATGATPTDNEGLTDAVTADSGVTIADLEGLTDSIVAAAQITITDSEGLTDNQLAQLGPIIDDALALTDSVEGTLGVILADPEGLTDETIPDTAIVIIDNEGLTDTIEVEPGVWITDDLGLLDDLITTMGVIVVIDDALNMTDLIEVVIPQNNPGVGCAVIDFAASTGSASFAAATATISFAASTGSLSFAAATATLDFAAATATVSFLECP